MWFLPNLLETDIKNARIFYVYSCFTVELLMSQNVQPTLNGSLCLQGDYAAARMYYQRALLLNPGSKLLKENLAKLDRLERRLSAGEK